jgi:ribosome-binding protein aMBF1 (putative translation factor)
MLKIPTGDGWFRVEKKIKKKKSEDDDNCPARNVNTTLKSYNVESPHDTIEYINQKNNYGGYHVTNIEFVNALKAARLSNGLTRKQLAAQLNTKELLIASYETAGREANYGIINRINRILNTTLPKLTYIKNDNLDD